MRAEAGPIEDVPVSAMTKSFGLKEVCPAKIERLHRNRVTALAHHWPERNRMNRRLTTALCYTAREFSKDILHLDIRVGL
jgi:hypothetical protein